MTQQQLKQGIARCEAAIEQIENELLERVRRERIIPFCEERGCQFIVGMGGFAFHHAEDTSCGWGGRKYDDDSSRKSDKQWQSLYKLLTTELPWCRANDVGSLCKDYTASTYKAKETQ